MKKLDLHGKRHDSVETEVINFILMNELPVEIITGDSQRMRSIVAKAVKKHNLAFYPKGLTNHGSFIVVEKTEYCFVCECDPCDCHWGNY